MKVGREFMASGYPVIFGNHADGFGCGVAFGVEAAGQEQINVDTEGIWTLEVNAWDDDGVSPVQIGDVIFIDRISCYLSKKSSGMIFGYALDTLSAGSSSAIAIKVHGADYTPETQYPAMAWIDTEGTLQLCLYCGCQLPDDDKPNCSQCGGPGIDKA